MIILQRTETYKYELYFENFGAIEKNIKLLQFSGKYYFIYRGNYNVIISTSA